MECSSCGKTAAADAKFCSGCGARLERSSEETTAPPTRPAKPDKGSSQCPRCRKSNEPGSDFCFSCGSPLDGGTGSTGRIETAAQEPSARSVEPAELRRAGFWVRFCAAAIDGIIVMIAFGAVGAVLFPQDVHPFDPAYDRSSSDLIWFIFNLLYYSLGVSVWSTTIGKRALGLYVLRSDGSKVGFLRAVGRWFSYIISALILFIGFFMIGLRQDKRGLHDLICDTVVVSSPGGRP